MRIGIDLRSLQDKTSRGVSAYAAPLISELTKQNDANQFCGLVSLRAHAPNFKIATKKLFLPSKLANAALAFLNYPKIDEYLETPTVWLPNLNFWSFKKTARVILTVHDLSFLVNPSWYSAKERLWHRAINTKKLIARADKIITLSSHTARELTELLKVPTEKIAVIPPGVPPVVSSLHNPHGMSPSFPYILFLGVIEPRKNIQTALAAFNLLAQKNKDIHFVLAGPRQMNHVPYTMNHPDRIHFLGQVTQEEKGALLRNARALFFPSFYEGFGFPALEAMTAGVPVVASSVGALPETIHDAGILLNPRDTGAFAEALDQVLSDNNLRQTLISRGYERVKNFSWEKCAAETVKTIKNF